MFLIVTVNIKSTLVGHLRQNQDCILLTYKESTLPVQNNTKVKFENEDGTGFISINKRQSINQQNHPNGKTKQNEILY